MCQGLRSVPTQNVIQKLFYLFGTTTDEMASTLQDFVYEKLRQNSETISHKNCQFEIQLCAYKLVY